MADNHHTDDRQTRRRLIAGTAAGIAVFLAGCSDPDDGDDGDDDGGRGY